MYGKRTKTNYKRSTKKTTKKSVKPKRTYRKASNVSVAKVVKSVLRKQVEVKHADFISNKGIVISPYGYEISNTPSVLSTISTIIKLDNIYDVSQGTGQGQRIGNYINPRKVIFAGHLASVQTVQPSTGMNLVPNPCYVKMLICRQRQTLAQPTSMANFFQDGNTVAPPSNDLTDMTSELNHDDWIFYKIKTFKIGQVTGTGTTNNDFKLSMLFKMDITKYFPKRIRYDDNNADPTNTGLYVVFLVAYADVNQTPSATSYPAVSMSYSLNGSFTDQ